uniref:Flavonoid 3',5'-hydroxylase n=1 Tax=Pohlia nutans TaxID=140635 RepID=W5XRQ0_9BRYO|nr:flavonoid 3',5'-hydroxylase [Pohlia nutans]
MKRLLLLVVSISTSVIRALVVAVGLCRIHIFAKENFPAFACFCKNMGASIVAAVAHVTRHSLLEYGVAVLAILGLVMVLRRPLKKKLPPGPVGLPIMGSLHLLGPRPHQRLAQMAEKYGPVMSLYMGQKLCVVATSADTAMEFLKAQDAVFCSRPPLRAAQVIFPTDITFSDITPASRQMRKMLHLQLTSGKRIEESEQIRSEEMAHMVRTIAASGRGGEEPELTVNVKASLDAMTANIFTRLIISKRFFSPGGILRGMQEAELREFIAITDEIDLCLGLPNPRDLIPAFRWLDLASGLDKRFHSLRRRMESFLSTIIAEHRQHHSFEKLDLLHVLLQQMEKDDDGQEITEPQVTSIVWEAFAAGMETSALATEWAMAEILRNPHILKKAQSEVDAVVGKDRRVRESDIPMLKYIKAIVKEALRLHPIIPLLVPHQSNVACKALGYDIPTKTQLLVNVWAIGRDPTVWTNPLTFDPERFLDDGAHADTDFSGKEFNLLPFGSGRRMCMGMSLGVLLVETSIASLLHCFSWTAAPDLDMTEGLGLSNSKAIPLCAIASARLPSSLYAH